MQWPWAPGSYACHAKFEFNNFTVFQFLSLEVHVFLNEGHKSASPSAVAATSHMADPQVLFVIFYHLFVVVDLILYHIVGC